MYITTKTSMNQATKHVKRIALSILKCAIGVIDASVNNFVYAGKLLSRLTIAVLKIAVGLALLYGIGKLCTASETDVLAFVANPAPALQSVLADTLLNVRSGLLWAYEAFKELMSPWTSFIQTIMSLR